MSETMNVESAPAVAVQRVVRHLWTSEQPKKEGRYRLKCGKHEKNFTVKLIQNDPKSLFLIGDDFSTMVFKCGGVEKWKALDA